MKLDNWQEDVLKTAGNIVLRSGRQVGKSTIIGLKAAKFALENPKKLVMIISKTERQAGLLFAKVLNNLNTIQRNAIKMGKDRPTKHLINLKNGSTIHSLPAGDTGFGIMGFTIDLLIADEAAFIPEEVWNSIIPALAITRGEIWLLSTPFIKEGYYYQCFENPSFTAFHMSSEDCPRKDAVFLAQQKKVLSKSQYTQMYLGEFVDDLRQYFSDATIKKACIGTGERKWTDNYLGVDVARMGEDESSFEIIEKSGNHLNHIHHEITEKTLTTDTAQKIRNLHQSFNLKKIFIDDGGVGAGVFDQLLIQDETKRIVVAINNASKGLDKDAKQKRRILKEDLYDNLRALMERGDITLLDNDEVKASLKSIQFEYTEDRRIKISGQYSHITEGLIRAAWCVRGKHLNNLWAAYR